MLCVTCREIRFLTPRACRKEYCNHFLSRGTAFRCKHLQTELNNLLPWSNNGKPPFHVSVLICTLYYAGNRAVKHVKRFPFFFFFNLGKINFSTKLKDLKLRTPQKLIIKYKSIKNDLSLLHNSKLGKTFVLRLHAASCVLISFLICNDMRCSALMHAQ